jgi:hypothetical protein
MKMLENIPNSAKLMYEDTTTNVRILLPEHLTRFGTFW